MWHHEEGELEVAHDLLEIIPGFVVGLLLTVTVSHRTAKRSNTPTVQ